jgi:hypothetical protein
MLQLTMIKQRFENKRISTIIAISLITIVSFHQIDDSSVAQSMYSSTLAANSSTYSPTGCGVSNYYYEAIQVNVAKTSCYSFDSNSNINTVGYIYKHNFNQFDPFENLMLRIDANLTSTQLKVDVNFEASTTYILIVTTSSPNMAGAFSIVVSGPSNISLNRISEYLYHLVNNQQECTRPRNCF